MNDMDYGPGMARATQMLKDGGYASEKKAKGVKKVVRKALREHENAEHGGKHEKLKLRSGGHVKGEKAAERPDRRARGGAMKPKVGAVNITIGKDGVGDAAQDQQKQQMAAKAGLQKGIQVGAQLGARQAAQHMAPPGGAPPMGGPGMPPPGGPPMAGPGGPPPPMMPRARGGATKLTAGAGSALGRLEKAGKVHVKAHERSRGGKC